MTLKKILLICNHFAPDNAIAAIRTTKLAKYFLKEGYYVKVIAEKKTDPLEDEILKKDAEGIEVVRVANINEKITLINADIEGNELSLLQALREIIVRDRPVLSLCVYHKKEDLVLIPQYIDLTVSDYAFILRKYAPATNESRQFTELVMYFVPKERLELK